MRSKAIIKVVGVGGAGCNAVEHMIREGVTGVEFMCLDSGNAKDLGQGKADVNLQCIVGLFTAYNREVSMRRVASAERKRVAAILRSIEHGKRKWEADFGRRAASAEREYVADKLRGADMVFIVASMGGRAGISGAPVVAEIAREVGAVPVAVVTKPFESGSERLRFAEEGIAKLARYVDSPIVLPNVGTTEAYRYGDNMLKLAVGGISDIINVPGMVGMDFADVRTVMTEKGGGAMGAATASGVDRARIAVNRAVRSPLLGCADMSHASGVLVNITAAGSSLNLDEVYEVMDTVRELTREDAIVVFGTANDERMADRLRVAVIATGIGSPAKRVDLSKFQPTDDDIPAFLRRL